MIINNGKRIKVPVRKTHYQGEEGGIAVHLRELPFQIIPMCQGHPLIDHQEFGSQTSHQNHIFRFL